MHRAGIATGLVHCLCGGKAGPVGEGSGVAFSQRKVTGGILIKQDGVEDKVACCDGATLVYQGNFPKSSGPLIDGEEGIHRLFAHTSRIVDHFSVFEGEPDLLGIVVEYRDGFGSGDISFCTQSVGSGEDFLGRQIGKERPAVGKCFASSDEPCFTS
ncbi:hypothetical protein SDC9_208501 [bioreactor metagenome]|uniref:Uncharacterized protein n=1 Tax=bioreactor metagenome TaxID=1076179 RepID=A0A645JDL7_9ZZZZ